MRRCGVLIALLLVVNLRAADTWTYGASEHFEVYTTGSAGTAREALTFFESVHAFFVGFFRMSPPSKTPTRLIIFSNDRQFAPYRPNESAEAFFQAGADRDYIVMRRLDEESNPVVVHEYAHLIFRHSGAKYPVWLNEGLAEFFSTMTPEGSGKMAIGNVPLDRLIYLREGGVAMFPLDRLFAVGHDSPEYNTRTHAGIFYSQSWALTHMLLVDDRYRVKQAEFLQRMAAGMPSAEVLTTVYGKTLQAIGADLNNYVSRSQFLYYPVPYKSPSGNVKYQTRSADGFEADLVTANLLANSPSGREAALAAYEKLEKQRPDDLSLIESRAYFELRRNSRPAALSYFARAIALGSQNVGLIRDYVRLDPSQAATLLPKALALAPDDVDLRLEQAALLVGERKSSQAVLSMLGLSSLNRDQAFRFYQLLANAYLQLNQIDDARKAAAQVSALAEGQGQTGYAARLNKAIDDYAGQRAAFDARARTAETPPTTGDVVKGATPRDLSLSPIVTDPASAEQAAILVTGHIINVECTRNEPILEVATNGQTLRLLIDNPKAISVRGQPNYEIDLTCGPQDVPIRIGYKPGVDPERRTIGLVRMLDYGK